ncbi:MAG: hypothetical protein ACI8Z1_002776 [Candidatus Azotimanducaceae bacterium]
MTREFYAQGKNGAFLQSRSSLSYKTSNRLDVSMEMFNLYGSTTADLNFEEQSHQLGPMVSCNIGNAWSVQVGKLLGLGKQSPDVDYRLFLGKKLEAIGSVLWIHDCSFMI